MSASLPAARFVARETAISAIINGVISAGFFFAVFGRASTVAVWGPGGVALDFLPQSFAVAFFATIVPLLMARRAISRGAVISANPNGGSARSPFGAAVVSGLLALLLGGGAWAATLWAAGLQTVPAAAALVIKIAYGAALGALITRFHLRRLLGPR